MDFHSYKKIFKLSKILFFCVQKFRVICSRVHITEGKIFIMSNYQNFFFKKILSFSEKYFSEQVSSFMKAYYRDLFSDKVIVHDQDLLLKEKNLALYLNAAQNMQKVLEEKAPFDTPYVNFLNLSGDLENKFEGKSNYTALQVVMKGMVFSISTIFNVLKKHGIVVVKAVYPSFCKKEGSYVFASSNDLNDLYGMTIFINHVTSDSFFEKINQQIRQALLELSVVVDGYSVMVEKVEEVKNGYKNPSKKNKSRGKILFNFLDWLQKDNFTFMGYMEFTVKAEEGGLWTFAYTDNSYGLAAMEGYLFLENSLSVENARVRFSTFMDQERVSIITKTDAHTLIQRIGPMDVLFIKGFDAQEKSSVNRLIILVGLFTSNIYKNSARYVPYLSDRIDLIVYNLGMNPESHDGKELIRILENIPRGELFHAPLEDLMSMSLGILHLNKGARTGVFLRLEYLERYVSLLIYVPRIVFGAKLRKKCEKILASVLQGPVTLLQGDSSGDYHSRWHFMVDLQGKKVDMQSVKILLDEKISQLSYTWPEELREGLLRKHSDFDVSHGLILRYEEVFSPLYQDNYSVKQALLDIEILELILHDNQSHFILRKGDQPYIFDLKLFYQGPDIELSDIMPILENMGVRAIKEVSYAFLLNISGELKKVCLLTFQLRIQQEFDEETPAIFHEFSNCAKLVWEGKVENDGFNALVLHGGLIAEEILILRAYAKYLKQANFSFSHDFIAEVFLKNGNVAKNLVRLFYIYFDPAVKYREDESKILKGQIEASLEKVVSYDHGVVLHRYLNLIESTLRTNFFQKTSSGTRKDSLSLKFNSRSILELVEPIPMIEIFVYAVSVEGIHLRMGLVARGGLRWSDRREDFRTEILGLVKAQQVKNAVIVPVGSKGGFVLKGDCQGLSREEYLEEGKRCYRIFISALLDVTDNYVENKIVPPVDVVRRDGDDPYLVVAADKGTATFSDIANEISQSYKFWLSDAFASGGSNGYDHKVMGITARGAWEAVKRSFRELNHDTQSQPFEVVGIGDMSGDVFGNGMLLSEHIRLIVAFNHMHIFIDPSPDLAKSFQERKRLFALPRSTWDDYDRSVLSKGGMIILRSANKVVLTPEVQEKLRVKQSEITINVLLKTILSLETDLLWFGGIGTYIKSSEELNSQVGDRVNDIIRIDACDIQAKVIGEGANLGMTQLGRIEAAMKGIKLNTDAIDNSAGVDCSDHEVNIKILFNGLVSQGKLKLEERDKLLKEMTEEVARLVLRDNYLQTQALSVLHYARRDLFASQVRLIRFLEEKNCLNRKVEYLPNAEELSLRRSNGIYLTRPEVAIILSYGKLYVFEELMKTQLIDDKYFESDLLKYFPVQMHDRFKEAILNHQLRREIIATAVSNSIINRVGGSFIPQLVERTAVSSEDVARAYIIVRDAFLMRDIWVELEQGDLKLLADVQLDIFTKFNVFIENCCLWILQNFTGNVNMVELKDSLKNTFQAIKNVDIAEYVSSEAYEKVQEESQGLQEKNISKKIADHVSAINYFTKTGCIMLIEQNTQKEHKDILKLYFLVESYFSLDILRFHLKNEMLGEYWNKMAATSMSYTLYYAHRIMVQNMLQEGVEITQEGIVKWVKEYQSITMRLLNILDELKLQKEITLSMVFAVGRQFELLGKFFENRK